MIPRIVRITDPAFLVGTGSDSFFTSLEGENPGGSIKDWMVESELRDLMACGKLRSGDSVAEATQGSTGKSLIHYCRQFGLRCVLFVPEDIDPQTRALLETGAEVHAVPMAGGLERFAAHCRDHGIHRFNQLLDPLKRRHYRAFGQGVLRTMGKVDAVIGAVGTGHSLLGIAEGAGPGTVTISAEPLRNDVSGIRNLDLTNYGPEDPCSPSRFDRRVILDRPDFFPSAGLPAETEITLETTEGRIRMTDSFRLVLAASREASEGGGRSFFLVGAANRLAG